MLRGTLAAIAALLLLVPAAGAVTGAPSPAYTVTTGPAENSLPDADTLVAGSGCDDCKVAVHPPFPVRVFGRSHDTLWVSSNGFITHDSSAPATPTNACLPFDAPWGTDDVVIAPLWDNLTLAENAGDGVYVGVAGAAPDRTYVVEWRGETVIGGTDARFRVIFREGADMTFAYTAAPTGSATIGVQSDSPSPVSQFSCNSPQPALAGTSREFTQNRPVATPAGPVRTGDTLTATQGVNWQGVGPILFAEASWVRCAVNPAVRCSELAELESGLAYVTAPDDIGRRVAVDLTGSNAEGATTRRSAPSDVVLGSRRHVVSTFTGSITGADADQTGRVERDGSTRTCGEPAPVKPNPGDPEALDHDVHTVPPAFNLDPVCLMVSFDMAGCAGAQTMVVSYPGAYNPAAPAEGAAGFWGFSTISVGGHGLKVEPGQATTVVVHTAETGTTCPAYEVEVASAEPLARSRPTVPAGAPTVGVPLTGAAGEWTGDPQPALDVRWQRCFGRGEACEDVENGAGVTYTPTAADVGTRLRLDVVASDVSGSGHARSVLTPPVVAPATAPPAATPDPTPSATAVRFRQRFAKGRKGARVRLLTVDRLPEGATVRATCKVAKRFAKRRPKPCAFKRVTRTATKPDAAVKLLGRFKKRRLPVGTVVTVQVTEPGGKVTTRRYTVKRGKVVIRTRTSEN